MHQPPPEQQWTLVLGDPARPSQVIRSGGAAPPRQGATVLTVFVVLLAPVAAVVHLCSWGLIYGADERANAREGLVLIVAPVFWYLAMGVWLLLLGTMATLAAVAQQWWLLGCVGVLGIGATVVEIVGYLLA